MNEAWIDDSGDVLDASEYGDYNHIIHVWEIICASNGIDYETYQQIWNDPDNEEDPHDILTNMGFTDEELSVLCNNPPSDPRIFAMKRWGWKRVEGKNIETWSATKKDLKLIADGLYEIYPEVEDNPDMPFNIEVVGQNRAFYTRVPFWQIDEGKFSSMQRGDQYGLAFSKKRIIQSLKYSQILDNYGKYMESDYIISNL